MDLATAYRACARTTRREARNFYYAFLALPRRQRRSVYALYAFCREADDIVDSARPADDKRRELGVLRDRLSKAAADGPVMAQDLALADSIWRFGIRTADLDDILTGMEMDLTLRRVGSESEMERYCYHVASAVGLATLPILNDGTPPTDAMREAAVDLGLGMQYVNILRDIREDLERDRVYLPAERLEKFGVTEQVLGEGEVTPPIRALLADHADRAAELLASGLRLSPQLPRGGRRCTRLLAELYGRVLSRIRAADYDVFTGRISLPTAEKLGLLVKGLWS